MKGDTDREIEREKRNAARKINTEKEKGLEKYTETDGQRNIG
jgi:hypothetical protein